MANNKLPSSVILSALASLSTSAPALALSLLDNLSPTSASDSAAFAVGIEPIFAGTPGVGNQAAIGFTLPEGSNYILNSIDLRLSSYNSNDGDIPELLIFEDPTRTSTNPNGAINPSIVQAFPPLFIE